MEKLICSCCGAAIIPNITSAFLTCEYCDTSIPNPRYDESAAADAAKPSLEERCITALLEMGQDQNLAKLDPDCFGTPINGIDTARASLSIPDAQQVYLLYQHTLLFLALSDGLALTDGGVYYKCSTGEGILSWDAFVSSAIACTDCSGSQDGTLRLGSAIELPVKSDKDSRLARFLVDFHNHIYQLHTGDAAPAAWCVRESASADARDNSSLLETLLPAAGALLGVSSAQRKTIIRRTPTMHPTSRPTAPQDRRGHVVPPRPLHSQPHRPGAHHPSGGMGRPGGPSGRPGGPGHPGGMGRPGKGRR